MDTTPCIEALEGACEAGFDIMSPNGNQETVMKSTNADKPNDPQQPNHPEKQGKLKLETQESLIEDLRH